MFSCYGDVKRSGIQYVRFYGTAYYCTVYMKDVHKYLLILHVSKDMDVRCCFLHIIKHFLCLFHSHVCFQ